jgi:hypothetical protein
VNAQAEKILILYQVTSVLVAVLKLPFLAEQVFNIFCLN